MRFMIILNCNNTCYFKGEINMSAKIKKEDLIKGSIKIIRNKGIESLSARNLAKICECSTQPIFRLFENMEFSSFWNESNIAIIQNSELIDIINKKLK